MPLPDLKIENQKNLPKEHKHFPSISAIFRTCKNQKIFEFNSRFSEITLYQYDRNNNFIRSITSDGVVTKNTYDSNNNLVLTVTSGGTVEYYEYDDKGNMTYSVMGELFHEEIDVEDFQLDFSKLKQMETFFEYDFYPDGSIQRQYVYETQ